MGGYCETGFLKIGVGGNECASVRVLLMMLFSSTGGEKQKRIQRY